MTGTQPDYFVLSRESFRHSEKSAFEYGLVNHALSAAMRTLMKDYLVMVAQLEQQYRMVMRNLIFSILQFLLTYEII